MKRAGLYIKVRGHMLGVELDLIPAVFVGVLFHTCPVCSYVQFGLTLVTVTVKLTRVDHPDYGGAV